VLCRLFRGEYSILVQQLDFALVRADSLCNSLVVVGKIIHQLPNKLVHLHRAMTALRAIDPHRHQHRFRQVNIQNTVWDVTVVGIWMYSRRS
jgi:hypothetical protein